MLLAAPSFVWSAAVSDLSCLSDSQQMEGERERVERGRERGEERRGPPLMCVCASGRERERERDRRRIEGGGTTRQTARPWAKMDIAVAKVTGTGTGEMRWQRHIK